MHGAVQAERMPEKVQSSSSSATVDGAFTDLNDLVDFMLFWLMDFAVTVDAEPPSVSS